MKAKKDFITCIRTAKGFESNPHRIGNCFSDYFTIINTYTQKSKPNMILENV